MSTLIGIFEIGWGRIAMGGPWMTKLSTTAQFHTTADDMLAILTDPELITRQQQQQGAVEVSVQSEPAGPNRLRQQVDMISYAQGIRGIDRSIVQRDRGTVGISRSSGTLPSISRICSTAASLLLPSASSMEMLTLTLA